MESKSVFISYSHDNEDHMEWVYKLACDLVKNGVETVLDQWDLALGSNLPKFMEKGLRDSDRVLVICTDNYIEKSDEGLGGVGYEKTILTAELLLNQDTKKFIPIVRGVTKAMKTPLCLGGRFYVDFSDDDLYEESLDQLLHEIYEVPARPKPKLGKNPFVPEEPEKPKLREDSTVFFYKRFSDAFPGVRGVEWFDSPEEAIKRLCILLQEPLNFENASPIWWWRSGDLHINKFSHVDGDVVLMDFDELKIRKIAAVNAGSYYQQFVYVETLASEPSGLYDYSFIEDSIERNGFAREEFAVFEGKFINRAEYDDGATVINGEPTKLEGKAELRVRYLSPYNFIIAPQNSPINNGRFDALRDDLLNGILKGEKIIDELVEALLRLPKRKK